MTINIPFDRALFFSISAFRLAVTRGLFDELEVFDLPFLMFFELFEVDEVAVDFLLFLDEDDALLLPFALEPSSLFSIATIYQQYTNNKPTINQEYI